MTIIQQLYSFRHIWTTGVPRTLQLRGFTWWGSGQEVWGRKYPSGVKGQSPSWESGDILSPPEAEAKCEISVPF